MQPSLTSDNLTVRPKKKPKQDGHLAFALQKPPERFSPQQLPRGEEYDDPIPIRLRGGR